MKLKLSYKNCRGTAELCGSSSPFHVTDILGLGLPEREYVTATYSGYDGQETLFSSCFARSITVSGDIVSQNLRADLINAMDIMSAPGYLYIESGDINRRIYCNQTIFPEAERILRGKICTFAIQFVCDSPFFENTEDTSVALYSRSKELSTPFSLPSVFGTTVAEATITLKSRNRVEPIIRILCPSELSDTTSIVINNLTGGKKIELLYTLSTGEEIVIDIKNRTVTSSVNGNIINCLSDDTFLSDFCFEEFTNNISATVGDINAGIFIECIYNDRYSEALLV